MILSKNLLTQIIDFSSAVLAGELLDPQAIAIALDKLSDSAWEEAEAQDQELAPSLRLE